MAVVSPSSCRAGAVRFRKNLPGGGVKSAPASCRYSQVTFRDGGQRTGWCDPQAVEEAIPQYSDAAVQATTIDYCEYVYGSYVRFPAACGPFRSVLAYQAHQLDSEFCTRFYRPEAI